MAKKLTRIWSPPSFKRMLAEEKAKYPDKSYIDIMEEMANEKKGGKQIGFKFPKL